MKKLNMFKINYLLATGLSSNLPHSIAMKLITPLPHQKTSSTSALLSTGTTLPPPLPHSVGERYCHALPQKMTVSTRALLSIGTAVLSPLPQSAGERYCHTLPHEMMQSTSALLSVDRTLLSPLPLKMMLSTSAPRRGRRPLSLKEPGRRRWLEQKLRKNQHSPRK